MMKDQQLSLLFVDDEPGILSALKRQFRNSEYRIHTADSGDAALDTIHRRQVDIIVSDQLMPGMNGVELLTRVRQEYPKILRIILSGYTNVESILRAINDGHIHRFITKPWDADNLAAHIRELAKLKQLEWENANLQDQLKEKNESLLYTNIKLSIKNSENIAGLIDQIPVPLMCINQDGMILSTNKSFSNLPFDVPQKGQGILQTLPKSLSLRIVEDIEKLMGDGRTRELSDQKSGMQVAISQIGSEDCFVTAVRMLQ